MPRIVKCGLIQTALAAKSDDIRACYDGVLKGSPGVGGKVTVHFDIPKAEDPGAGTITKTLPNGIAAIANYDRADRLTSLVNGSLSSFTS